MVKTPAAKWAQRADKILLTIDVPDLDPAQTKVLHRSLQGSLACQEPHFSPQVGRESAPFLKHNPAMKPAPSH
jgi:hypothetical protein